MTAYARAHVMRNSSLEIDEVEYANQVTKAIIVPDTPTQTLRTLAPDGVIQDTDSASWMFELAGVQDFGAGSLGAALRTAAAAGTEMDVVYQPKLGTGQDVATFSIKPVQIPFGAEQGAFRVFDVEIPVVGEPTWSQSA
jgi:hypothetical protein